MSTVSRFQTGAGKENTSRIISNEVQSPAYAATLTLAVSKARTLVQVGQLTGAITVNVNVGNAAADDIAPFLGDTLEILFSADGTNRVITFGTGFKSPGTVTCVAAKFAVAKFTYDGANWIGSGTATT